MTYEKYTNEQFDFHQYFVIDTEICFNFTLVQ